MCALVTGVQTCALPILRDELDALVSSLAFLQQVGLTPIVVHGAGPQLDEAMQAVGIDKRVVDNLRHTDAAVLAVVRRVLRHENLRLVEALKVDAVRAPSIKSAVFASEILDSDHNAIGNTARREKGGKKG